MPLSLATASSLKTGPDGYHGGTPQPLQEGLQRHMRRRPGWVLEASCGVPELLVQNAACRVVLPQAGAQNSVSFPLQAAAGREGTNPLHLQGGAVRSAGLRAGHHCLSRPRRMPHLPVWLPQSLHTSGGACCVSLGRESGLHKHSAASCSHLFQLLSAGKFVDYS